MKTLATQLAGLAFDSSLSLGMCVSCYVYRFAAADTSTVFVG